MIVEHFFLLTIFDLALADVKKYFNYTLYRSVPSTEAHLDFLKTLDSEFQVDFWKQPGQVNMPVDLLVSPEEKAAFLQKMNEKKISVTTLIEDMQSAIDNQAVRDNGRRQSTNKTSFDWKNYYRLQIIYDWIRDLADRYPNEVTIIELGRTYESREILAVKVLFNDTKIRSTVIIEGGIHAREWISPAFVTYFMNEIITNGVSIKNSTWKNLAMTYEWYFIPVANPDGYEYTHTSDRLWRKNRWEGYGVDLNKNFDIAFGTEEVEKYKKQSSIYCGPRPFSERETSALADLIRSHKDSLEYYLAFHSYGQYIILPYAHRQEHLSNYDEVENIMIGAAKKIFRRYSTNYTVGTAYEKFGYTTSGMSACWVKSSFDVRYVATFELRDADWGFSFGFTLPPKFILPTCYETMDGMQHILSPKTLSPTKLNREQNKPYDHDGQTTFVLDTFIIVLNIIHLYYIIF